MKTSFILMADVLKSRLADGKDVARQLKQLTDAINKQFKRDILSPLTVTLGDEFQGVVSTAEKGISIIIQLEEMIIANALSIELRYVLSKGRIDTPLNKKIAHGMMGEGLTRTREALGLLKKTDDRFLVQLADKKDSLLNKYFALYQSVVDSWKIKDRKMIGDFLEIDDYKAVADKNKKNWSQMWKRKKSLKIKEYNIIRQLILGENGNLK